MGLLKTRLSVADAPGARLPLLVTRFQNAPCRSPPSGAVPLALAALIPPVTLPASVTRIGWVELAGVALEEVLVMVIVWLTCLPEGSTVPLVHPTRRRA